MAFHVEMGRIRKQVIYKKFLKKGGEEGTKDKSYLVCYIWYQKPKYLKDSRNAKQKYYTKIIRCVKKFLGGMCMQNCFKKRA